MPYLLLQGGGRLRLQGGGCLLLQPRAPLPPWGVPAGQWVCPPLGRAWACPGGGREWKAVPMATFAGFLEKTPGDRVWLVFNFGNLPELRAAGLTLADPVVAAPPPLVAEAPTVEPNGYRVGAWYSGGVDAASYDVSCTVTLSDGSVINRTGTLQVRTKST